MADISVALTLDNKEYLNNIKQSSQATSDFSRQAESSANQVTSAFQKMSNASGAVVEKFKTLKFAALAAFVAMTKGAMDSSGAIVDLSNSTGIAIETIKGFQDAAMLMGGSVEGATNGITLFITKIDEAASSSQKLRNQFGEVGVTLNDIATLSEQDILRKTIEGLAKMPESARKTALQADLLGKSFRGVAINQEFLDNLDAGEEKARKLVDQIRRADELGDRWDRAMKQIKDSFLEAFGPMLDAVAWLLKNIPSLTTAFKVLGAVVAAAFVATGLRTFISLIGGAVKGVQALTSGFKTLTRSRITGELVKKPMTPTEKIGAIGNVGGLIGGAATLAGIAGISAAGVGQPEEPTTPTTTEKPPIGRPIEDLLGARKSAIEDVAAAFEKANEQQRKQIEIDIEMIGKSREYQEIKKAELDVDKRSAEAIEKLRKQKEGLKPEEAALATEIDKQIQAIEKSTQAQKAALPPIVQRSEATRIATEFEMKFKDRLVESNRALQDLKFDNALIGLSEYERRTRQAEKASKDWADTTIRDLAKAAGISEEAFRRMYADKVAETYRKARQDLAEYNDEIKNNIELNIQSGNANFAIQQRLGFYDRERELLAQINNRDMTELERRLYAIDEAARKSAESRIRDVDRTRFSVQQLAEGYSIANAEASKGGDAAMVKTITDAATQGVGALKGLETTSYEVQRTFNQGWKDSFRTYLEDVSNTAKQSKTYFDLISRGIEDTIVRFVRTGKLSFKEFANSIIAEFVRIEAKALVTKFLPKDLGTGGGGGLFDVIKGIGSAIFGGGRAMGGPVAAGVPYMVGERGAEMFVPNTAGRIVPNGDLRGGGTSQVITNVTYSIQAVDAASFKQLVARDPEFLYSVTEQGRRNLPTRSRR